MVTARINKYLAQIGVASRRKVGPIEIGKLKPGEYRELSEEEIVQQDPSYHSLT